MLIGNRSASVDGLSAANLVDSPAPAGTVRNLAAGHRCRNVAVVDAMVALGEGRATAGGAK
jgi:hypothetical protein